ncbi:hypothetical protein SCORR_v1c03010 [Spiroplasma corruscae]|uniref:Uncharacterized protein n=1 Tax=Spiroplasma corruscae TaxID=216934 RepID=A0A222ENJ8_9MOLU|nr:hypothetical protein [Spiroplasma corruscae]ASP28075.1 hypothetical protein SCORR_v1c03010 [Spiroplasma corruscae]
MVKKTSKNRNLSKFNDSKFNLISDKTKLRIKGLIEKRLTTKTILIFAQEYESYDLAVRKQLISYISYLFNQEEEIYHQEFNRNIQQDPRSKHLQQIRWLELSEKRENIKRIEEILIKTDPETIVENLTVDTSKVIEIEQVPEEKPKKIKPLKPKNEESKIEKMLREAQIREQNEYKLREKKAAEEKLKKEQYEKEKELRAKKQAENKEVKSDKVKKNNNLIESKSEKEIQIKKKDTIKKEIKKSQPNIVINHNQTEEKQVSTAKVDRNYEKEQAEKEKLWKELYGSTRSVGGKVPNDNENNSKKVFVPTDKTPSIDFDELTHFVICGRSFEIAEYSSANNKYFIFWRKMAKKFKMSNLTVWLNLNINKQPKLLKKRLKFEKKIEKRFKLNNQLDSRVKKEKPMKNTKENDTKNETVEINS